MSESQSARRGRIGSPVSRPTSWWLKTLKQRAESMYEDEEKLPPAEFASDAERLACISFFTAALRAEESGSSQAKQLAAAMREIDPDLAECLELYGAEENWHRGLIVDFLRDIGADVQPLGGLTGFFYRTYAKARHLPTIMLSNLMFEVIGSTTYRIALGRVQQPAVRKMLTILARDESFHVPLNVHFIREVLRHKQPSTLGRAKLRAIYYAVFGALIASSAASREVAQRFDHISFRELSTAYVENLGRLFLKEPDLAFEPPWALLRLFGIDRARLQSGDDWVTSVAAAEAAAVRENVRVTAL